jgi:hypothetical protein
LNEGTDCWRPVEAVHIAGSRYQITDHPPDDEEWAFPNGAIVHCDLRTFADGMTGLTAICVES